MGSSKFKMHQNSFLVGTPVRSPLAELTTPSPFPSHLDSFVNLISLAFGASLLDAFSTLHI